MKGTNVSHSDSLERRGFFSIVLELVKIRLSLLVLATTAVGFFLGVHQPWTGGLLIATLCGTALSACGSAALNQWMERDYDRLMQRTQDRPLPAGYLHPQDAWYIGVGCSSLGILILMVFVNWFAAGLAALTVGIYLLVYTPLKRVNSLNTLVGAIPGALPPLLGWVAATGHFGLEGWILFAILWFWQMPHFLAIAWRYREEYHRAGFHLLTSQDTEGRATACQSLLYALCLWVVSLLPALVGLNTELYFYGALGLGAGFVFLTAQFAWGRTSVLARNLFLGSILYLPLLLGWLVLTKNTNSFSG